tara:strand:+ start:594 stop:908 length:315 start_codon:yes stop_codon:yes gene_type:complete
MKSKKEIEFSMFELVNVKSPDNTKTFIVNEEFTDGNYIHTSGIMEWNSGGAGIMYFTGKGKRVSAKWIDNNNLEIIYEQNLIFDKNENESFFQGDKVKIEYKAE